MRRDYEDYDAELESSYGGQMGQSIMPPDREERESPEIGIIREMSPAKILRNIRMNLKGFFWNPENKQFEKIANFQPMMNDVGINKYMDVLSSFLNDTLTFSNYNEMEVGRICLHICEEVIPVIHVNYVEFGIKSKTDLPLVDMKIFVMSLSALKKAMGAGDRAVIGRTITENIMTRSGMPMQNMREEKKGFFNRINPFSR